MSGVEDNSKKKKKLDSYLKYSGLGFQLAFVILGSIYIGGWLDSKLGNETAYVTLVLVAVVFGAFMYKLTKELS